MNIETRPTDAQRKELRRDLIETIIVGVIILILLAFA